MVDDRGGNGFLFLVAGVVGIVVGVLGFLGYQRFIIVPPPPPAPNLVDGVVNGPPVIIHGGSFHIIVAAKNIKKTDPLPLKVPTDDVSSVKFGAAYNMPSLTAPWKILVCNDATCDNAIQVCSADKTGNCASSPSSGPGSIVLSEIGSVTVAPGSIPSQFSIESRFGVVQDPLHPAGLLHPAFVKVITGGTAVTYPCPGVPDWTSCWMAFGLGAS